ncbi:MAG: DUF6259 domain-containing protein [Oscillospiraceae bacterium]|nr:DUF6259 domain-containing protein [Oscillospiraceae bacterium]
MIRVEGGKVYADTKMLSAIFEQGYLISLRSKATGEDFIGACDPREGSALELVYRNAPSNYKNGGHNGACMGSGVDYPDVPGVEVSGGSNAVVNAYSVSNTIAEYRFHNWHADGVIIIREDEENGELIIEPSAFSGRAGVRAVRWNLCGIIPECRLIAPLYQGVDMDLEDPLISGSAFPWPFQWEAGLALLQSKKGGFWIRTEDTQYRYKQLKIGAPWNPRTIGLETEAYGPIDENLSAGGLEWRIACYEGNWETPAAQYRDWLFNTYNLKAQQDRRLPWLHDISFAISWCPVDMGVLEALKKKVDPKKTLLHIPHWRTHKYDQNYPTYIASAEAKAFFDKAAEMGFHAAPHCNAFEIDPSHELFPLVVDFRYRKLESNFNEGWTVPQGSRIEVPASRLTLATTSKTANTMTKIHPGHGMWVSILREALQGVVKDTKVDTIFIDITLNTFNLHNSLCNNVTSTEGAVREIDYLSRMGGGVALGGEGSNETTMRGLHFCQAHLMYPWYKLDKYDECANIRAVPLNEFLFGAICRTIGYTGLSGKTEMEEARMKMHDAHGAIPTVTIRTADEIEHPNKVVQWMIDKANS